MAQKLETKTPHEVNERVFNILVKEGLIKKHEDQAIQSVNISLSANQYPRINVTYDYTEKIED